MLSLFTESIFLLLLYLYKNFIGCVILESQFLFVKTLLTLLHCLPSLNVAVVETESHWFFFSQLIGNWIFLPNLKKSFVAPFVVTRVYIYTYIIYLNYFTSLSPRIGYSLSVYKFTYSLISGSFFQYYWILFFSVPFVGFSNSEKPLIMLDETCLSSMFIIFSLII